jgi:hypothetical protein
MDAVFPSFDPKNHTVVFCNFYWIYCFIPFFAGASYTADADPFDGASGGERSFDAIREGLGFD